MNDSWSLRSHQGDRCTQRPGAPGHCEECHWAWNTWKKKFPCRERVYIYSMSRGKGKRKKSLWGVIFIACIERRDKVWKLPTADDVIAAQFLLPFCLEEYEWFRANESIMLFTSPGLIRDIHSLAHNLPFYFEGSKDVDRCVVRLFTLPQVFSAHSGFGDLLLVHRAGGCTHSQNSCVWPHSWWEIKAVFQILTDPQRSIDFSGNFGCQGARARKGSYMGFIFFQRHN